MSVRRKIVPWIVAAVAAAIGALVLIAAAWSTRRGDYSDCLQTAAAIQRGQSKARVLASLSRFQVTRNDERQVIAICDPERKDVRLPFYPVMAIEIDVDVDARGQVANVATSDVLMWRKRARRNQSQ